MMNRHWVGIRWEASGASKATPTVAKASEATCNILCTYFINIFSTDLLVIIDVAYTPPVDFDRPSVNDFRAGSAPVTLTCQVEGATGDVSYQWTSTCTGACFVGGISQSVTRTMFLRAGIDDGTHTCTATDSGGGETGSASFVMRIIGMFVSSLLCTGIITSSGLHSLPLLQVLGCLCLSTLMRLPAYPLVPCQTMALLLHLVHELVTSRLPSSVVLVQGLIYLFVNSLDSMDNHLALVVD